MITAAVWSEGLILRADYNSYVNSEEALAADSLPVADAVDGSVSFGLAYRFWGIFLFEGNMYTNFVFGGDNFFGIKEVLPVDLMSYGFGMQIPMGGLSLCMDWQRFFSGFGAADNGLNEFSNSFKLGAMFQINPGVGLEVYHRRLYDFTSADPDYSMNIYGAGIAVMW